MTAQSVILPLASIHARFIVLRLKDLTLDELKAQCNHLLNTQNQLIIQYPDTEIKLGIAFGTTLWQQLYHQQPNGFYDLAEINGAFHMPSVPADVFIHLASDRSDICFALSQAFFAGIEQKIELLDERVCFRYLDSRDLTGFIDGTENPQYNDERAEVALLDQQQGEFADGSFVFAQRYVHDLDKWQKLKVNVQEKIIGRTKIDSIELDDDIRPENAHISRVVIEDKQGEEMEILRHSLPYGDGQGDKGLYFVAYTHNLTILDQMLQRMFGTSDDNIHDRFLHFTTAQDGAYYFMPSQQLLAQVLATH